MEISHAKLCLKKIISVVVLISLLSCILACNSNVHDYKISTTPLVQKIALIETRLWPEPIVAAYDNNTDENSLILLHQNSTADYLSEIGLKNNKVGKHIPCNVCVKNNSILPFNVRPYFQSGRWLLLDDKGVYEVDGKELWQSSKLISPIKYFIRNKSLFLITLESESSIDTLSVRDFEGHIIRSIRLEEYGFQEGDVFTKDSKELETALNIDSSLDEIIINVKLGPKKNGFAQVFNPNLIVQRKIDLDISRTAKPVHWPTDKVNYFINGDMGGDNAIVKTSENKKIFSAKIVGQCPVYRHFIVDNIAFDGHTNDIAVVFTGNYECPLSILSVFNSEGTLIWQKEYPTIRSINKKQISSNEQILLLSTSEGLIKLALETVKNRKPPE